MVGVTVRQDEAGAWLEWMLELAFRGIERMSAFLFQSYDGSVFRNGPLQGLILHRDDNVCTDNPNSKPGIFQCADERGVFMPNNAWCAGSVDPVRRAPQCVRHAALDIQRTMIHEMGHYWDAKARWVFSEILSQETGGSTTPRRAPRPGMFCPNPPSRERPQDDECYVPGRPEELPSRPGNRREDWAEAVAFRSFWDQPTPPGFTLSWRWHYAKCAADGRASDRVGASRAAGCAWDRVDRPLQP